MRWYESVCTLVGGYGLVQGRMYACECESMCMLVGGYVCGCKSVCNMVVACALVGGCTCVGARACNMVVACALVGGCTCVGARACVIWWLRVRWWVDVRALERTYVKVCVRVFDCVLIVKK